MRREEYWFWLCNIPGIFPEEIRKLLERFQDPETVFRLNPEEKELSGILTPKQVRSMKEEKKSLSCLHTLDRIKKEEIRFVYPECCDFPARLKNIPEAPVCLYVKGNLPDPSLPTVGMVGARRCTEYGKKMALSFAGKLAEHQVQIVSGMANGIDGYSAKGALSAGGKTFAVLGGGVDVIYPMGNFNLYYEILSAGGGIISEYPAGTPALAWQFPYRNRIISGLSDKLLVMEARMRSGTSITVRYALEQSRDIYALPGRLTDKNSEGCIQLIADGAGILTTPEALLSEIYKIPFLTETGEEEEKKVPPELKKIYDLIGDDPLSIDRIIEKTGESPGTAACALAELELSGLIREVSKNNYVR